MEAVTITAERIPTFSMIPIKLPPEKTLDIGFYGVKPKAIVRLYFLTNLCNPMELTPAA
jgi:hypothetical protein